MTRILYEYLQLFFQVNFFFQHGFLLINPILHGGGPADPPWRDISHDVDAPIELVTYDFVDFNIMSH